MPPARPALDRFREKVEVDPTTGCHLWTGAISHKGYGFFLLDSCGKQTSAHRAAYQMFIGPIPPGTEVEHRCHTEDPTCDRRNDCLHRRCVNPDHLEAITHQENECTCGKGHVPSIHLRSEMDWAATPHNPKYVPGLTSTYHTAPWPLPNVWLGTSVESADYLRRIDDLRETPAAVRFVSAEPLLGPLDGITLTGIDWLIVGGESGPGARPLDLGWVRDLRDRCADAGVACFVKQLGTRWAASAGRAGKGNHAELWPEDLRVRQYPQVEAVPA